MLDYSYTITSICCFSTLSPSCQWTSCQSYSSSSSRDGIPFSTFASDNVVIQLTVDKITVDNYSTSFHQSILLTFSILFDQTRLSDLFFCQLSTSIVVNWFVENIGPDSYRENRWPSFKKIISSVENIGVEPMTSCLQSRRSSQLS